jgi:hypothetical protein
MEAVSLEEQQATPRATAAVREPESSSIVFTAPLLIAYLCALFAFILVDGSADPTSKNASFYDGKFWLVNLTLSLNFAIMSACIGQHVGNGVVCLGILLLASVVISSVDSLCFQIGLQLSCLLLALLASLIRYGRIRAPRFYGEFRTGLMISYLSLQHMVFLYMERKVPEWVPSPFLVMFFCLDCIMLIPLVLNMWKRKPALRINMFSAILYTAYTMFVAFALFATILSIQYPLPLKPIASLTIPLLVSYILLSISGISASFFPKIDRLFVKYRVLFISIWLALFGASTAFYLALLPRALSSYKMGAGNGTLTMMAGGNETFATEAATEGLTASTTGFSATKATIPSTTALQGNSSSYGPVGD